MQDQATKDLPRLLTAREVARETGLPLSRVYELGRTGELPAIRFGRAMRFSATELRARLRAGATAGD
jgi:excisionase family DNA binding protein